jgi:hypothetical protein
LFKLFIGIIRRTKKLIVKSDQSIHRRRLIINANNLWQRAEPNFSLLVMMVGACGEKMIIRIVQPLASFTGLAQFSKYYEDRASK